MGFIKETGIYMSFLEKNLTQNKILYTIGVIQFFELVQTLSKVAFGAEVSWIRVVKRVESLNWNKVGFSRHSGVLSDNLSCNITGFKIVSFRFC